MADLRPCGVSAALIVGGVFWGIGKNKEAAGRAATRFAAALVENDPGAAPKGSPEYIKGIRAYFGAVTGARVIGTHNERADANTNTSRTYPVADVLLRAERGPAVIELAFDNGGIGSEKVTGIYELHPDDAPGIAGTRSRAAGLGVRRARRHPGKQGHARARNPPDRATRRAPPVVVAQPARAKPTPELRAGRKDLRCVQRARGDVAKLADSLTPLAASPGYARL